MTNTEDSNLLHVDLEVLLVLALKAMVNISEHFLEIQLNISQRKNKLFL